MCYFTFTARCILRVEKPKVSYGYCTSVQRKLHVMVGWQLVPFGTLGGCPGTACTAAACSLPSSEIAHSNLLPWSFFSCFHIKSVQIQSTGLPLCTLNHWCGSFTVVPFLYLFCNPLHVKMFQMLKIWQSSDSSCVCNGTVLNLQKLHLRTCYWNVPGILLEYDSFHLRVSWSIMLTFMVSVFFRTKVSQCEGDPCSLGEEDEELDLCV